MGGFAGTEPRLARLLVRLAAEKQKPNEQRLREYTEARLPSLEQQLFSTAPVYKSLDTVLLASSLALMRDKLGAEHPAGEAGAEGADSASGGQGSHREYQDQRRRPFAGNCTRAGCARSSIAPTRLIVLMRELDPAARELRKQWDDQVESVLRENGTLIAKARFAVEGTRSLSRRHLHLAPELRRGQGISAERADDSLHHHSRRSLRARRRAWQSRALTSCRNRGLTAKA